MKGNVIQMNTLHLNSVRLNGIGKVQSVSLKGGSTEDPVFPPVEPPVEPTPTYTLSASVTNGKVSATRNGSAVNLPYTANEGDTIVVEVTPNEGYTFEGWADGNTDNPRTITMTADVVLSAQCVEVVVPSKYIQFEDKAVEAICVENWSSDGIGLTEEDAAKVTSISTWFRGNKSIKSFDELKYFTGVKSLVGDAFAEATNLETISLPPHCTIIGSAAFWRCSKLATINGLEQVTSVGSQGCLTAKITSLSLPNYQGAIAERAFSYCSNLEVADLGAGVTQLSGEVFSSDTKLATLIVRATTPPSLVGSNFYQCPLSVIYVPDASLEAYKTATNWVSFADRIHPLSEIEDYYVSDALLMHLDGINKGNVEGEWQDLVSGNTFVNHGAIAEADGWEFDGTSASMESQSLGAFTWVEKSRTIEVVLTFYREGVNEIAFAGMEGCMAFGRYQNEYILSMAPRDLPSVNAEVSRGLIFGASYSNGIFVRALANGEPRQKASEQQYWGNAVSNYSFLGRRSNGTYFKGKIHAIRIHDRILSEEEILYNQRIDNKRFNLGLDI